MTDANLWQKLSSLETTKELIQEQINELRKVLGLPIPDSPNAPQSSPVVRVIRRRQISPEVRAKRIEQLHKARAILEEKRRKEREQKTGGATSQAKHYAVQSI